MKIEAHFALAENGNINWDIKFNKDIDKKTIINVLKNFLDGLICLDNDNNKRDSDYALTNLIKGVIFQNRKMSGILYAEHEAPFFSLELPQ